MDKVLDIQNTPTPSVFPTLLQLRQLLASHTVFCKPHTSDTNVIPYTLYSDKKHGLH